MIKSLSILTLLSLLCISCSTLSKIQQSNNQELNNFNQLKIIEGDFHLKSDSTCGGLDLADAFNFKTDFNCINHSDSTHFIRLSTLRKKRLKAELFHADTLIEKRLFKGKLKHNYFVLKPYFSATSKYGVLNAIRSRQTRVGVMQNGNLTLDSQNGGCGLFLVLPIICTSNSHYNNEFQRIIYRKN